MKNTRNALFSAAGRLRTKFMNMQLAGKVVVIYVIAVLLPTLVLAIGFYQMNLRGLEQTYYENQRNALLSAKENLTIQLNQISAAGNYYQQSDTLLELLNETYSDVSNTLFYYIRDVNPLVKATKVNPYIESVSIYGYGEYAINMENGLASVEYMNRDENYVEQIKSSGELWELSLDGGGAKLYRYQQITANTYPYSRGILAFTVDLNALAASFYNQISRPFYVVAEDGRVLEYEDGVLSECESEMENLLEENSQVYELSFAEGFPRVLVSIPPMRNVQRQGGQILFTLVILVIVFTAFYVLLNASVTKRLKGFADHIRNTDAQKLTPYENMGYQDEVGVAIRSYNGLVERTNDLIHENLKARISKSESDYYALQAQIKPHFFYNILENIRMSAEAHQDPDTADMLLALGKHMRYNLNRSSQPILLEDELYFARNFFQIHQIRMKDKIRLEVLTAAEIDDVYCPRFLLQPLLENALQHGYRMDCQLNIRIQVTDGEECGYPGCVQVSIEDDGNGMEPEELEKLQEKLRKREVEETRHVGLLNVNSRLASFCGIGESCMEIRSRKDEGTQLVFRLKHGFPGKAEGGKEQKGENTDCRG